MTVDEGRLILGQLKELSVCREDTAAYEKFVERDKEQDARDQALAARELDNEKRNTEIAERERDLEREQKEFYKKMYEEFTRTRGLKCFLIKFFTLWQKGC